MRTFSLVLVLVILFSCNDDLVFERFEVLEDSWKEEQPITFQFEIEDISKNYDLEVGFRYGNQYSFYNLYVEYLLASKSDTLTHKLEEIILFEPKTGKPMGSGLGDVFDIEKIVQRQFRFEQPGTYTLSLMQFMRREELTEIEHVGFRLSQSSPE
ncbi:MAG: gliding motility lipoprotein GldH [Cyclobacteriaceae bacterium]